MTAMGVETESEKLIKQGMRQGRAQTIVELGQKDGLDEAKILERLQEMVDLSIQEAEAYLAEYKSSLCRFLPY